MSNIKTWNAARSPNYETNNDKLYPYSEFPYLSEYKPIKIPICVTDLIEHVDYFGEGRLEISTGTIGFPDCYNVNHQYALVTDGPDKGRKIPNRIPLSENEMAHTINHLKDNSVLTVTVTGKEEFIVKSSAQDIVRIVNSDRGKVIAYYLEDKEYELITEELIMKQLFYCPIYLLPDKLQLTFCNTNFRAYLSMNILKRGLYKNVCKGNVEAAFILTGCLNNAYCGNALGDVVNELLENKIRNVIVYAYKLWNNNTKDVVCKHFPKVFQQLFKGDYLAIINKQYNQAMVLEPKTMQAWGDGKYKSSNKLGWKITPIWEDDNVLFKLYNIDSDMCLELSPAAGDDGDRKACGSEVSKEDSKELIDKFYLEPLMMNGQVAFTISSCESGKLLELPADVDSSEDRAVMGHKRVGSDQGGHSEWVLVASNQVKEKDWYHQSDDESDEYD